MLHSFSSFILWGSNFRVWLDLEVKLLQLACSGYFDVVEIMYVLNV